MGIVSLLRPATGPGPRPPSTVLTHPDFQTIRFWFAAASSTGALPPGAFPEILDHGQDPVSAFVRRRRWFPPEPQGIGSCPVVPKSLRIYKGPAYNFKGGPERAHEKQTFNTRSRFRLLRNRIDGVRAVGKRHQLGDDRDSDLRSVNRCTRLRNNLEGIDRDGRCNRSLCSGSHLQW